MAVLVLSNRVPTTVPHVISFDGTVDDDTLFEYDANTQSAYSCSATINDEFWVFGGQDFKRQVLLSHMMHLRCHITGVI